MDIGGRATIALVITLLLAGCTQRPSDAGPGEDVGAPGSGVGALPAITGNEQQDLATLARLKDEARGFAKAQGCSQADQCRSAPLGSKPCGGPWEYLVYCTVTTDSSALFRQLEIVRQYEDSVNRRYDRVSTCELIAPPRTVLEGSVCRAANP